MTCTNRTKKNKCKIETLGDVVNCWSSTLWSTSKQIGKSLAYVNQHFFASLLDVLFFVHVLPHTRPFSVQCRVLVTILSMKVLCWTELGQCALHWMASACTLWPCQCRWRALRVNPWYRDLSWGKADVWWRTYLVTMLLKMLDARTSLDTASTSCSCWRCWVHSSLDTTRNTHEAPCSPKLLADSTEVPSGISFSDLYPL